MNLKEALKNKLTEKELEILVTSFDVVGDIAIIEIPEELEKKKKIIGKSLMDVNKHVKTVLRKLSERKGVYRTKDYEIIAGEKRTETVHTEYGCRYKLDIEKVYFSPRESTERLKIAGQVKRKEKVLVMFAGVGPFAILIAKKNPDVKVYTIEINPDAVKYMEKNIVMNKVSDRVVPIQGDVRKVCPKYYGEFDRVLMPLPKESQKFLDVAIRCLNPKGGIIHYYSCSRDSFSEAEKLLKKITRRFKRKVKFLDKRKVLPYSPGTWKICVDAKFT